METTPRIGREIGSTTDHRMRSGDAPSMPAAQQFPGIESKKRLSRKMLKPLATAGSQIAQGVSSRFQLKIGRSGDGQVLRDDQTVAGIISVASISAEDDVAEHRAQLGQRVGRGHVEDQLEGQAPKA